MDYKDTLLLPKTKFPMRGNLPQNEPKRYKRWEELKVYEQMKKNREDRDIFTLHDGPPYANWDIPLLGFQRPLKIKIIYKDFFTYLKPIKLNFSRGKIPW